MEFSKETEKMGMQQEQMQDGFDMMADPDQEAESEDVYNMILGEIGMNMNGEIAAGSGAIAQP